MWCSAFSGGWSSKSFGERETPRQTFFTNSQLEVLYCISIYSLSRRACASQFLKQHLLLWYFSLFSFFFCNCWKSHTMTFTMQKFESTASQLKGSAHRVQGAKPSEFRKSTMTDALEKVRRSRGVVWLLQVGLELLFTPLYTKMI